MPRSVLAISSDLNFIVDETGERLYAEATSSWTGMDGRELFSFGNGTFFDGLEAKEILRSDGKFVSCCLKNDTYIMLEKKKIFAHLSDLACLDNAHTLEEVLRMLEDMGEFPTVSHHVRLPDGKGIESEKQLVFALDTSSERPKKKQKVAKGHKKAGHVDLQLIDVLVLSCVYPLSVLCVTWLRVSPPRRH